MKQLFRAPAAGREKADQLFIFCVGFLDQLQSSLSPPDPGETPFDGKAAGVGTPGQRRPEVPGAGPSEGPKGPLIVPGMWGGGLGVFLRD